MYRDRHSEFSSLGGSTSLHTPQAWHLVYTKPRQEQIALTNLEQQGFEAYLPLYKTLRKSSSEGGVADALVFEPMFARYVFFRPSSTRQSIAGVRSTRGVCSLVAFGTEPARLSPEVVATVRDCERERTQCDLAALSPIQPGVVARLRSGPLHGLVGVVQMVSARRVTLLLELLGQQHHVQVERQALSLV